MGSGNYGSFRTADDASFTRTNTNTTHQKREWEREQWGSIK